jgi:hypothetical protein
MYNETETKPEIDKQEYSRDTALGVSIENTSYIESQTQDSQVSDNFTLEESKNPIQNNEEHTPQLFSESEENRVETESKETEIATESQTETLFDQTNEDDEDFEIPAFLRRQKF